MHLSFYYAFDSIEYFSKWTSLNCKFKFEIHILTALLKATVTTVFNFHQVRDKLGYFMVI